MEVKDLLAGLWLVIGIDMHALGTYRVSYCRRDCACRAHDSLPCRLVYIEDITIWLLWYDKGVPWCVRSG